MAFLLVIGWHLFVYCEDGFFVIKSMTNYFLEDAIFIFNSMVVILLKTNGMEFLLFEVWHLLEIVCHFYY